MSTIATRFTAVFRELMAINLLAASKAVVTTTTTEQAIEELLVPGERLLPMPFRAGYSAPLTEHVPTLIEQLRDSGQLDPSFAESLFGAVYQHADPKLLPHLHRFLAVISNMYRSFLDGTKRAQLDIRLDETLPPLAVFQSDPSNGPFTITCDSIKTLIGGDIGVVSLPHTFADHPILYGSLAHETGGHDVIHADAELLPQLKAQARLMFDGADAWLALLWDYWMDEAAADVYGVLNMGPTFGHNLALLLAVFIGQAEKVENTAPPALRTESGSTEDGSLDPHPTDLLRLALVQGVVENLNGLSPSTRQTYVEELSALAKSLGSGATQVRLSGFVRGANSQTTDIQKSVPLEAMQVAARRVGAMIAMSPLAALGGRSIQDLETWDDSDENAATAIAGRLTAGSTAIRGLGDDAQIIAGLTLAVLQKPMAYTKSNEAAAVALDDSFARDPFWGRAKLDQFLIKPSRRLEDTEKDTDPYAAEIIDFNPLDEDAAMASVLGVGTVLRHAIEPIPWPKKLAPESDTSFVFRGPDAELPRADIVFITWTSAEANAMSAVLTPGAWAMPPAKFQGPSWHEYTNQWAAKFAGRSTGRAPAASAHYIGKYMPIQIGGKRVLLFKSNFHLARDDKSMPVKDMFKQVIQQTHAKLVITTGTAGAVGSKLALGDVVVARSAVFHCGRRFKDAPFNHQTFGSAFLPTETGHLATVNEKLIAANAGQLAGERDGRPAVFTTKKSTGEPATIVTTDEFEFDDAKNGFGLQGLGAMVEMDDAVLGLAVQEMGADTQWLAIRNASDPQMPGTTKTEMDRAADIYKQFGYWTSIPSVLACWAMALDF